MTSDLRPGEPVIELDPGALAERRQARDLRLNIVEIPRLRVLGYWLLCVAVLIHQRYIIRDFSLTDWLEITVILQIYAVGSWLALRKFYRRGSTFDLGFFFLIADLAAFSLVIYATGAERSWLFFVPLVRVADQATTTFRRAVVFAHLAALSFAITPAWSLLVAGRPVEWGYAGAKLIFLYGAGLYISLSARSAERLRSRTAGSMRIARSLIDRLEQSSNELELARQRAEDSNRAKSEFLASISHEIRTPLNAILGMTGITLQSELTPEQRRCLETVRSSAESLLAIVNDLLDLSKIEARKLSLGSYPYHLRETLGDSMKALGVRAAHKGLELVLDVDRDVPDRMIGDYTRLRQVIFNLVGNGIKFTDRGEVVVHVSLGELSGRDAVLRFTVRDTGIGIPPEKQAMIFEAFVQAGETSNQLFAGTGLGLAIAARLVELMNGSIWVESEPGSGSQFHFTIRTRIDEAQAYPPLWKHERKRAALVVDDNASARRAAGEMLRRRGFEPSEARDAVDALSLLNGGLRPEIALVDASLSNIDGFELADEMARKIPRSSIYMLIGSAGDFAAASRTRQQQFRAAIPKPLTDFELERALNSPVPGDETSPKVSVKTRRTVRPLNALVVDDDPVNRELAMSLLSRWGHHASAAESGVDALIALGGTQFDIVLLDVQMPEMDGLEVAAAIRDQEHAGTRRLPILGMTAHALRGDRDKCLSAGMDDYLPKPIDEQRLFRKLEKIAARLAESDRVRAAMISCAGGDMDLAGRVARLFLERFPRMMDEISLAIGQMDLEAVARTAHTLKGSVANFPFPDATAAASRLETIGRSGQFGDADRAFVDLMDQLEIVRERLAAFINELRYSTLSDVAEDSNEPVRPRPVSRVSPEH